VVTNADRRARSTTPAYVAASFCQIVDAAITTNPVAEGLGHTGHDGPCCTTIRAVITAHA